MVLALVMAYWLAAVHVASAEEINNGVHTSSTLMEAAGSGPVVYQADAKSTAYYADDSNYTYSRGYNDSRDTGWHNVSTQSCGFEAGVTNTCTVADVFAGSSQDRASERRVSTRHSYWWPTDASEYYTSGRYQGGIINYDGRYSSYNCVYNTVC